MQLPERIEFQRQSIECNPILFSRTNPDNIHTQSFRHLSDHYKKKPVFYYVNLYTNSRRQASSGSYLPILFENANFEKPQKDHRTAWKHPLTCPMHTYSLTTPSKRAYGLHRATPSCSDLAYGRGSTREIVS